MQDIVYVVYRSTTVVHGQESSDNINSHDVVLVTENEEIARKTAICYSTPTPEDRYPEPHFYRSATLTREMPAKVVAFFKAQKQQERNCIEAQLNDHRAKVVELEKKLKEF